MRCIYCNRDLNEIYQDNMSTIPGKPICEDCYDKKYPCNKPNRNTSRMGYVAKYYKTKYKYKGEK